MASELPANVSTKDIEVELKARNIDINSAINLTKKQRKETYRKKVYEIIR